MQLLSIEEAAQNLRPSPVTVRRMIKAGTIPYRRLGIDGKNARIFFTSDDLTAYLEAAAFREKWQDGGDTGPTSAAGGTPAAEQPPGGDWPPMPAADNEEERARKFEEAVRENARRAQETADHLFPGEQWVQKAEYGERIFVSPRRATSSTKSNFQEELRDAQILRDLGGTVYLNPEVKGEKGKKSDAILNGETIEFKNVGGNANTLITQFLKSRAQSPNVFINLENSSLTKQEVLSALYGARNRVTHTDKTGRLVKGFEDCNSFTGGRIILKIPNYTDLIFFDVDDLKLL